MALDRARHAQQAPPIRGRRHRLVEPPPRLLLRESCAHDGACAASAVLERVRHAGVTVATQPVRRLHHCRSTPSGSHEVGSGGASSCGDTRDAGTNGFPHLSRLWLDSRHNAAVERRQRRHRRRCFHGASRQGWRCVTHIDLSACQEERGRSLQRHTMGARPSAKIFLCLPPKRAA